MVPRRTRLAVLGILVVIGSAFAVRQDAHYRPPEGFVPDSVTAVRIAIAVWSPIYGEERIRAQAPHRATLTGEVWKVTGTLPQNAVGGVASAEIAKQDARVIRVTHGR